MIPDGAKNLTLNYAEDYQEAKRCMVGVEVKGKYGKIRVPSEYIGEELIVLIPKEVYESVKKKVVGRKKK